MNKRKSWHPRAIERVEAIFARLRAAEHDPAALDAVMADILAEIDARNDADRKKMDAVLVEDRKKMDETLKKMGKLNETIEQLGQLADPREQRKRRAAEIKRERRREWAADMRRKHAALVDEYRRSGEDSPATRAWNELAAQHGYNSGETLSRSVRRND